MAVMRHWPMFLLLLLVAGSCSFHLLLLSDREKQSQNWLQAKAHLRRILVLGYGVWQEQGELDSRQVWRRLGKTEAIRDPWGSPYQIQASPLELQVSSAGPDTQVGTLDDLIYSLPKDLPQPNTELLPPLEGEPRNTIPEDAGKSLGSGAQ